MNAPRLLELRLFPLVATTGDLVRAAHEYNESLRVDLPSLVARANRIEHLRRVHHVSTAVVTTCYSAFALTPVLGTWSRRVTRELRFAMRALDCSPSRAGVPAPEIISTPLPSEFHAFRAELPVELSALCDAASHVVDADDVAALLMARWNNAFAGRPVTPGTVSAHNLQWFCRLHDLTAKIPAAWRRLAAETSVQALALGDVARERLAEEHLKG